MPNTVPACLSVRFHPCKWFGLDLTIPIWALYIALSAVAGGPDAVLKVIEVREHTSTVEANHVVKSTPSSFAETHVE